MPNNSRLALLTAYLADQTDFPPDEIAGQASALLVDLDAKDPLRQPPSDEAVCAGTGAWCGPAWRDWDSAPHLVSRMRRSIVAALAVMREETASPPPANPRPTLYQALAVVLPMTRRYAEDAGESSAIATVVWAEGILRDATDPEPRVVPPDAIKDRLAALEARPQFTAPMADLIQYLAGTAMMTFDKTIVRRIIVEKLNAAFPVNTNPPTADLQPERVWPPTGCFDSFRCGQAKLCLDLYPFNDCPHAGERA